MTRLSLLLFLLAGCVSRTDVGAEVAPLPVDSGNPDADATAPDAPTLTPEEEAVRELERKLLGTWQGPVVTPLFGAVKLTMIFKPQAVYVMCDEAKKCAKPGLFFVTDRTSNGHFAGVLQDSAMQQTAWIDDMWIDEISSPAVLRFTLYDQLSLLQAVLTRVDD